MKSKESPVNEQQALLYNLSYLEEIGQHDASFVANMIQLFLSQVPGTLDELNHARSVSDRNNIKSLAHRMKSSVDTLGISCLRDTVRDLEATAAGGSWEEIDILLSTVNEVIPRTLAQLKEIS